MSNSRSNKRAVVAGISGTALANPTLPVVHSDGSFHSERTSRIVEIIRERWPVLDVKFIPSENRTDPNDPKYLIVEIVSGKEYPVFFVKDDKEFDGSVLERLLLSDNKTQNVHNMVEARNEAVRLIMKKEEEERREERIDKVKHAVKSHKHGYTMPDKDGKIINLDQHGAAILRGEIE